MFTLRTIVKSTVLCALLASSANAELVHRYSFSDLTDSVGTADAIIVDVGTNDADVDSTFSGQVYLAGGAKADSDYVKFPNGTISAFTGDATFEFWATPHSTQNWSRVFSWGSAPNTDVFMASWTRGTNTGQDQVRWVDTGVGAGDNDNAVNDSMQPYLPHGAQFHLAWTVDTDATGPGTKTAVKWYRNGTFQGQFDTWNKLSDLNDIESVLGRSKWPDNTANASWNEVRMYDHVLSAEDLNHSRHVGPDNVDTNAGNVAALDTLAIDYHEVALPGGSLNYDTPNLPEGSQTLGGVPFDIPAGDNAWHSVNDTGANRSVTVPVNIDGVLAVHTLMNTFWGQGGGAYASLLFTASDASTYEVQLYGDSDIRDYSGTAWTSTLNDITAEEVIPAGGQRIDKQMFVLPDDWANKTLASITLRDFGLDGQGADGFQRIWLAGLTVATASVPEPGTFVLAVLGLAGLACVGGRRRRARI
jgi:hypothetical protein